MKKTININLGGHPIIIDEDAYHILKQYLDSVSHYFHSSEGKDEIVQDIETRIAELFQEELKGKEIVSAREVHNVIETMGKPRDFESVEEGPAEEPGESDATDHHGGNQDEKQYRYSTGKRLFRDPNDKVIGGVASGLSAYFGISDPVWLRIAFVLVTVTTGFGLLAYILLWLIVPKARTASDRLAMYGQPINIESIAESVEEELTEFGHQVQEIGRKMKNKHKKRNRKKKEGERHQGE